MALGKIKKVKKEEILPEMLLELAFKKEQKVDNLQKLVLILGVMY